MTIQLFNTSDQQHPGLYWALCHFFDVLGMCVCIYISACDGCWPGFSVTVSNTCFMCVSMSGFECVYVLTAPPHHSDQLLAVQLSSDSHIPSSRSNMSFSKTYSWSHSVLLCPVSPLLVDTLYPNVLSLSLLTHLLTHSLEKQTRFDSLYYWGHVIAL